MRYRAPGHFSQVQNSQTPTINGTFLGFRIQDSLRIRGARGVSHGDEWLISAIIVLLTDPEVPGMIVITCNCR
jgi:hypothetical protein